MTTPFEDWKIFGKRKTRLDLSEVDLNDRELLFLSTLNEIGEATTVELINRLGIPNEYKVREAVIDFLTRLEGRGLVRRINSSPVRWVITNKARFNI